MFEIEVVCTDEQFASLEREWQGLFDSCDDLTYFLTWEFMSTRWKYFSEGRDLMVLLARNENGRLIGIAPWAIATVKVGPVSVRRLEFICRAEHAGHIHPYDGEDLDIIAPSEARPMVTASFIEHLDANSSSWDVTDLAWLSANSSLNALDARTSSRTMRQISTCYITTLPENWSIYEESVIGKSESRRIRRHGRRLERDFPGDVEYHLITDRAEVGPAMDQMIEMNLRRWTDVGQQTVFDDDRFIRFHREFVELAFDRGWLRYFQLKVGDEVAAATCGVILNNTYFLFQKGFDPAWSKYGPGVVLQAHELQQALEEGCTKYDWAPGAYESKRMWMDTTRDDVRSLAATRMKGNVLIGKELGIERGKRFVRKMLPQTAYQRLKRLVASVGAKRTADTAAVSDSAQNSQATNSSVGTQSS